MTFRASLKIVFSSSLSSASRDADGPTASRDNRPGIKSYKFKSDGPTDPGTSVPGRRSSSNRHHVSGQPRPVPDRTMLKPCMRPDTPCWKWMPTSPSTYGQGLARPASPRRPPGTFPLVGASEKHGPGTKISSFVPGPRVKLHVPGLVTRM